MSKLSLCWGSLEGVSFPEFLSSAADAGFESITLNSALYLEARSSGLSDKDIGACLQDNGLGVSDIDPLFNWMPGALTLEGSDAISVCTQASMSDVFHLAHVVGADLVNAPLGLASPDSEQEIVDGFAALCERASSEGLRVSLEFMPFNEVPDLATAARIVEKAGCSNGGIMLDCWHHHRSGGSAADILAIPGERFIAMQLDDALSQPMDDIMEETLNYRLLPGEGCIDLLQILRNLNAVGAELVYDVEVFSKALTPLAPVERARKMYESAMQLLAQV